MKPRPGEIWIDGRVKDRATGDMSKYYVIGSIPPGEVFDEEGVKIVYLDADGTWDESDDAINIGLEQIEMDGDRPDEATMVKRLIEEYELESR